MHEFHILVKSFRQMQAFVELATVQPFKVLVSSGNKEVNGKGFIGLLSLDCSTPLRVCVQCTDEEFGKFRKEATELLA